jgi:integrase
VDISEESLAEGKASIFINKELQRVRKSTMETLEKKDVLCVFPEHTSGTATVLVLKKPKTLTSTRRIYLPRTVAEMLIGWKRDQEMTKEELGSEYHDYQLVIAGPFGAPMEHGRINELFNQLIEQNNLPKVVFHSLRHSSITYKLKLNGGDVKSVQGDSGHAQAKMVTDQYSHILDEDRKNNAQIFEDVFYQKKTPGQIAAEQAGQSAGIDAELLMKILTNPEMAKLLKALAGTIE